ncbi:uncharacterized protein LOC143048457 [Mytilus galloprovincialis]|uniref:uncharacterized protein LOC143048457 n=1 Tax=Mytilus galloprovincialis TaxID=29158 RepID=UPI003F7B3863
MLQLLLTSAIIAYVSCVPMNVCNNYKYLYDQCLPHRNWICDKPAGYSPLDMRGLRQKLSQSDGSFIHYIKSCSECLGDPAPYGEKIDYVKKPVCREVKVPIEYINKTVYHELTGVAEGFEVCQVILNGPDRNVQKIYRTDCYNGDERKKNNYCRFDYGVFKEYFCRPTNFVYRTMLIDCPLTGLQYYKEKVSTACSCVKVKCLTGEVPGPFNNHGMRQGPVHVQEIRPKSIVRINPGFF